VTTYAPHHDTARDARIREAWTVYRDHLTDLEGDEYAAAEQDSWERLQDRLREIAEAHAAATGRDADPAS
jgi:transcription elongation GreA/GreB family factor